MVGRGLDSCGVGTGAGCCDSGNETAASIKCRVC